MSRHVAHCMAVFLFLLLQNRRSFAAAGANSFTSLSGGDVGSKMTTGQPTLQHAGGGGVGGPGNWNMASGASGTGQANAGDGASQGFGRHRY